MADSSLGQYESQWPELMAAAVFAAVHSGILLVLVQRGIRGGIATAGLKGSLRQRRAPRPEATYTASIARMLAIASAPPVSAGSEPVTAAQKARSWYS